MKISRLSGRAHVSTLEIAALFVWFVYGGSLWLIGRLEQIRPTRGSRARVPLPPIWLTSLCGVRSRVDSLHLPMAILQLAGIATALAGSMLMFLLGPGKHFEVPALFLLLAPAAIYLLTEGTMIVKGLLRRR